MQTDPPNHRELLFSIAHRAMLDRGLLPDFSSAELAELDNLKSPIFTANQTAGFNSGIRDLRECLWCSIDNDDSLDLDQLTVAEPLPGDKIKVLVAVADVDCLVKNGSAINDHAHHNTTSIYTAAAIFSMLPEQLSTGLTSLNFNDDRLAIVSEIIVNPDGSLDELPVIYQAWVRNHAKLAYNSLAAWLEGGDLPADVRLVPGLAENLRLQDKAAQSLKQFRHVHGALSLETIEARPVFDQDQISSLEIEEKNRAKELVENFMIGANGVTARYLSAKKFPSIRRVVRTPKRWERIVELAADHHFILSTTPDSKALEDFLVKQKTADPLRFPDLSLAVIKLMGPGEYVAEAPDGNNPTGHFGLAVKDYAHSTAPNRRYLDLVTQRLIKAAVQGQPAPYTLQELEILAAYCTTTEDEANKVERLVSKSAAALLLEARLGETFEAIITGASPKGTWVRLLKVPVEGKLISGFEGLDVGHRLRVQLKSVDIQQGYIDFKKIGATTQL